MSAIDYRDVLVDSLASHGVSCSVVRNLLECIAAPQSLIAFGRVVENLEQIFPFLNSIDPDVWSVEQIVAFQEVVAACQKVERDEWVKLIPSFDVQRRGKNQGLHGVLSDYPLYSAICFQINRAPDKKRYCLLQAQFLNACCHLKRFEDDEEAIFTSRRQVVSLLIRRVVTEAAYFKTLSLLPDAPLTMQAFHEWVGSASREKALPDIERLNLHNIELMLNYALGHKSAVRRNREYGVRVETRNQLVIDEPEEDAEDFPRQIICTSELDSNHGDELHLLGCSRVEALTGPKMVVEGRRLQPNRGLTPLIQAFRTQTRNRSIAMTNQMLPMDWGRLNQHDISALLRGIFDLLAERMVIAMDPEQREELVVVIAVMFWTSSSFERALGARVVRSIESLPKDFKDVELFFCLNESVWAVRQPVLDQRKTAEVSWQFQLRRCHSYILLPVCKHQRKVVKPWAARQAGGIRSISKPLFDMKNAGKLDDIERWLRAFFREVNCTYQSRLTILRVANHLFRVITDQTGDVGDAAIITGRHPSFGQATALYYYAPNSQRLQEVYLFVCNKILEEVHENRGEQYLQTEKIEPQKHGFVGSNICPLDETILLFVRDLTAKIKLLRRDLAHQDFLANFHNAYTSYMVALLGYATGYRAVRDPICSELDIDWQQGYVVICDKDSDDYNNTRIAWLPPVVLDQLRFYKCHRFALAERLLLRNPEISQILLERDSERANAVPFLFYLRKNGKSSHVSPYEISREIGWSYTLPLNANRYYLRTKLRELGACGEIVDLFMGHWDTGQEPHGRFSSLSPEAVRKHIEKPLTHLLDASGWRAIEGLS